MCIDNVAEKIIAPRKKHKTILFIKLVNTGSQTQITNLLDKTLKKTKRFCV